MKLMRVEYYESKIGKWVAMYETTNIDRARKFLDFPVVGNPPKRIAEYDRAGSRKIKYNFIKEIEEI